MAADARHDLVVDVHRLLGTGAKHLIPALQFRVLHQQRIPGLDFTHRAHVLGVIGDDEKIEWPAQASPLTGRSGHLFAAGEAIGFLRSEEVAEGDRVE